MPVQYMKGQPAASTYVQEKGCKILVGTFNILNLGTNYNVTKFLSCPIIKTDIKVNSCPKNLQSLKTNLSYQKFNSNS